MQMQNANIQYLSISSSCRTKYMHQLSMFVSDIFRRIWVRRNLNHFPLFLVHCISSRMFLPGQNFAILHVIQTTNSQQSIWRFILCLAEAQWFDLSLLATNMITTSNRTLNMPANTEISDKLATMVDYLESQGASFPDAKEHFASLADFHSKKYSHCAVPATYSFPSPPHPASLYLLHKGSANTPLNLKMCVGCGISLGCSLRKLLVLIFSKVESIYLGSTTMSSKRLCYLPSLNVIALVDLRRPLLPIFSLSNSNRYQSTFSLLNSLLSRFPLPI